MFLALTATDRKGAVGHHGEGLRSSNDAVIYVATDKIIYRPDDPIEVTLTSNRQDLMVFVQAAREDQVVASQPLRMRGGHAVLNFPPSNKFQNDITILASAFGTESEYGYDSQTYGYHTVLFPKSRELQLAVHPEQSTYRPGDEATVNLRVSGPQGETLQSAVGLVVVDKALEERQRTDAEFGAARGFYSFPVQSHDYRGYDGFLKKDLDKLDPAQPLPEGMDTVAELLLQSRQAYPNFFETYTDDWGLQQIVATEIIPQIQRLNTALNQHHQQTHDYPETFPALKELLANSGIHLEELRDPWGQPYKFEFKAVRESWVLALISSGPDKQFGTADDLKETGLYWAYFEPKKELIKAAGKSFHTRTGGYIRDIETLRSELARQGADLNTWKDPWGHAYRYDFGVATTQYIITVASAGPDGRFTTGVKPSDDDFTVAVIGFDYASELQEKIGNALNVVQYGEKRGEFPKNVEELQKRLELAGIAWDSLKDPWGHRYYATFIQGAVYGDSVTVQNNQGPGGANQPHTEIVPVTRKMSWIYIRSAGPNGIEGTKDDFTVASFSQARFKSSGYSAMAVLPQDQSVLIGSAGAISGTVTDSTGAVIINAEATAKDLERGDVFTAKSDAEGKYTLRNLPAGLYQVTVNYRGFNEFFIARVPVKSSSITALDVTLSVGSTATTVEVRGVGAVPFQTETSTVGPTASEKVEEPPIISSMSTPKLRDYFPETLLWQPELVTDSKGRAQIKFPLAGSITTWTLKAVASSVDGEVGTAEKEIRAFQPFFIDHDPPRFLTTGDEIDLPVVLRNYLDHRLEASVDMAPQNWFTLSNPAPQTAEIPPGDSVRNIFSFTAVSPVKQGKQRVTARSHDAADAIEKSVTVRPYGREKIQTLSQVFQGNTEMDVELPGDMVPGSLAAALKIYPNLNAHILESIEAIMQRPYGCGEQTISSTYPSLLYLRMAGEGNENSVFFGRAHHYLQLGYSRLLSYQAESGGFTYWGRGEGDVALTAYAVRFLRDAGKYITAAPA